MAKRRERSEKIYGRFWSDEGETSRSPLGVRRERGGFIKERRINHFC